MSEQVRVLVVFSASRDTATVTAEIFRGSERVAAYVFPERDVTDRLVTLALAAADDAFPRLFP